MVVDQGVDIHVSVGKLGLVSKLRSDETLSGFDLFGRRFAAQFRSG